MASEHLGTEFYYPLFLLDRAGMVTRPDQPSQKPGCRFSPKVSDVWLHSRKLHSQVSPSMRWMIREPIWVGNMTSRWERRFCHDQV